MSRVQLKQAPDEQGIHRQQSWRGKNQALFSAFWAPVTGFIGNNFSRVGGVWDDLSALGGGCEYRQSFPDSAAAHVLLCGPAPNRPVSGSGAGDPCRKAGMEWSSILAWETHGQISLEGYSPWGCRESDTTSDLLHTQDIAHKSAWVSTFLLCGSHDEVVNGEGKKNRI